MRAWRSIWFQPSMTWLSLTIRKDDPSDGSLLARGGKAEVISLVRHGDSPANCNTVTLGNNVLDIDVKIGKGSAEGAMDSFEWFGANKNRVRIRKAVGLALFIEHFVDRRFALLVPDLLKPAPQKKFVRLGHICPPNVGRSLEDFSCRCIGQLSA